MNPPDSSLLYVYSLFDRKMREYGSLVVNKNDEAIRRSLVDSVQGSGGIQEKHPEDFDLMCVGTFNPLTGVVGTVEVPTLVVNLKVLLDAYGKVTNA